MTDDELTKLKDDHDWYVFKMVEYRKRAKEAAKLIEDEEKRRKEMLINC
jgi:hypothetical protein